MTTSLVYGQLNGKNDTSHMNSSAHTLLDDNRPTEKCKFKKDPETERKDIQPKSDVVQH